MKMRNVALTAIALLTTVAGTAAYKLSGPKWSVQQVPYYVNPSNPHMSESAALAAIQAGVSAWSMQSNANIVPYYMGRSSGNSLSKNGKNEAFFRNTTNGSLYGETYTWWNSKNQLIEADIVFYTGKYRFYAGSSGCTNAGMYVQDAATHEFGHVLGLGHSSVSSASMYPSMRYCSTSVRTLDNDDLAGIEKLYPASGSTTNTAPSVSITSPSNGAAFKEGTSVTLSGSASDKEDGNLTANITWASNINGSLGTGGSVTRSLSAGSHTITAKVTDSRGVVSSKQISVSVTTTTTTSPAPAPSGDITLAGSGYRSGDRLYINLTWAGASTNYVDIFRDGSRIATTANDGAARDIKGGTSGMFTYTVCEAGSSTCSNSVTVKF